MVDTVRGLAALQALLADNTSQDISPQDVRDFLVSVYGIHLIDTQEVTGAAAAITFSSIPAHYRDLLITGSLRQSGAAKNIPSLAVQVGNGSVDTASNYRYGQHLIAGGTITDTNSASDTELQVGRVMGGANSAGFLSPVVIRIMDYTNTGIDRVVYCETAFYNDSATRSCTCQGGGQWDNTADVIDTVKVFPDPGGTETFAIGSKLSLFGLGVA